MEGEWSETMKSMVPSNRPPHSISRVETSRTGGQHLPAAAPSGISYASSVR